MVTAMDVFEHLADPVETVEKLWQTLKPAFSSAAPMASLRGRPLHIVQDFEPCFTRLRELGFVQVWQDDWLWGHQIFRKT